MLFDYSNINETEEIRNLPNYKVNEAYGKKEKEEEETEGIKTEDTNPNRVKKLEVVYAKNDYSNIFKDIIIFTNNRSPKDNKTLKNIIDAIKELKKRGNSIVPNLHVFVAAQVVADDDEKEITISDDEEVFTINKQSNLDTLIFSRLGVRGEDECEHIVNILQDRGFLILNPTRYSELASNKYETAVLLQKGEIPQPNFCLMTREILYDEKLYLESMKKIYPEFTGDGDKDEKLQFVVKILDGHGGTGVALIDGKRILAIFQMIFAIDPERQLIVQKKEEADGGDIRVHVLTLRNKQVILAAMKRIKIASDFRSNVSLGAEAEPVKLTPEQEQIALKAAKLSKLPWCAVDIMPLVAGSNKEIGDNVVLELNASPGTNGITEVIEENFISVLLSELTNPGEFLLQSKIAGYMESANVIFEEGEEPITVLAKLDTGNGSKASHIEVGEYKESNGEVSFSLNNKEYTFKKVGESHAITGSEEHNRPIIEIAEVTVGLRKVKNVKMAIVKSREQSTNMLINRDLLAQFGYAVSSNESHLLTDEMEKVKII